MENFANMGDDAPEEYPKVKSGLFGFGKKPVSQAEVLREFEEIKKSIKEFEKQASENADSVK